MIANDKENEYLLIFKKEIHKDFDFIIGLSNVKHRIINVENKLLLAQIVLPIILYLNKCDVYLFLAFPSPMLFLNSNLVNTVHDMTPWMYPETMSKKGLIYFRILIKNAMKRSKLILTVSNSSKIDIKKYFSNNNIEVIYNGIDNRFFDIISDKEIQKEKTQEKYNLPSKYLFSLGTVEPRKNLKLLIDAFINLRQENKVNDYKLVLSGRLGWKYDELLQRVKVNNLEKEIIFTGFIDDDDLPFVYSCAECFIFPSLYEGFGIPPLESMATGSPVIVANNSSLPEIVADAGIFFESNNISDLEKKIFTYINLEYEKKQELSQLSRKRAKSFSWEAGGKKLINLLLIFSKK
jgi:glycosyltransferase involved in cell wall biosynthesis